jgi:hypothetical protein
MYIPPATMLHYSISSFFVPFSSVSEIYFVCSGYICYKTATNATIDRPTAPWYPFRIVYSEVSNGY